MVIPVYVQLLFVCYVISKIYCESAPGTWFFLFW